MSEFSLKLSTFVDNTACTACVLAIHINRFASERMREACKISLPTIKRLAWQIGFRLLFDGPRFESDSEVVSCYVAGRKQIQ